MNYQNKAEGTHDKTQRLKANFHSCLPLAVVTVILFMIGCATNPPVTDIMDVSSEQSDRSMRAAVEAQNTDIDDNDAEAPVEDNYQTPSLAGSDPVSGAVFPTFRSTGNEICTNDEGRPLIYLFSSSMCSHCEWGGGVYDFIVKYYTANELIEAHRYDVLTGDDLMTEEVETLIPEDIFELYHRGNPEDLVPYYNFGCEYDRVGNGYEKENDLVAEGEEMRRVIEALMQMVSSGD